METTRQLPQGLGRRFLIVDDDESIALLLERLLGSHGDHARAVTTGEQALVELEGGSWDAMVADVRLPGMTGLELTARARLARPRLPIVVMTADVSVDVEGEARRSGADAFMAKPFSPRALKARVHQLASPGQSQAS